jgi:hypothetical protein
MRKKFENDYHKWDQMIESIKSVNEFLSSSDGSIYNMSYINPFNLIPLKTVAWV